MPAPNDGRAKPLIYCTRSILAWQAKAKTQTRRLIKTLTGTLPLEGLSVVQDSRICDEWVAQDERCFELLHQPYAMGQLLWIREALERYSDWGDGRPVAVYGADYELAPVHGPVHPWTWKRDKLPAMFMPRWACRYYARVVSVRPERLQDISEADMIAEGTMIGVGYSKPVMVNAYHGTRQNLYLQWWDELHRKPEHKSEASPWVWVYGLEEVADDRG